MRATQIAIVIIFSILLISLVSASITCSQNSLSISGFTNQAISNQTLICTNSDVNASVILNKIGNFFSTVPATPITFSPGESNKNIGLTFQTQTTSGISNGNLWFSDSTNPISISLNIQEQQNPSGVIVFPTAKVINVQQGQTKSQNIQVIVPSNYPRPITIQSVSFNPDIDLVRFGDLDLGVVNPGQTLNIPLNIDARNSQTGNYNTQITILATDSQGQVQLSPSNLQVVVSVGVNPITNDTFVNRPTCSLSAVELAINGTYTMSCSNVIQNIEVNTPYNEYIEGVRADFSGNVYTYTFRPVKIGNTKFITTFTYIGSAIFAPFMQDIRISSSGNTPVSGTSMKFDFYQSGNKVTQSTLIPGSVTILVLDDKTNSIVPSYKLFLNGLEVNNTFDIEADKLYELRADSNGYLAKVINFTATKKAVEILINPNMEFYNSGDIINVTTSPTNATIKLDGIETSSLITLYGGEHVISAIASGYLQGNKNISVKSSVTYKAMTPLLQDWGKGDSVTLELSSNSSWSVLRDSTEVAKGEGVFVSFKIEDYGTYIIKAGNDEVIRKTLEKKSWLSNLNWTWIIIVLVVFVGGYFLFFNKPKAESKSLMFNLGEGTE